MAYQQNDQGLVLAGNCPSWRETPANLKPQVGQIRESHKHTAAKEGCNHGRGREHLSTTDHTAPSGVTGKGRPRNWREIVSIGNPK